MKYKYAECFVNPYHFYVKIFECVYICHKHFMVQITVPLSIRPHLNFCHIFLRSNWSDQFQIWYTALYICTIKCIKVIFVALRYQLHVSWNFELSSIYNDRQKWGMIGGMLSTTCIQLMLFWCFFNYLLSFIVIFYC